MALRHQRDPLDWLSASLTHGKECSQEKRKRKKKKTHHNDENKKLFLLKTFEKDGKIKLIRVGLIWASYKE